MRFDRRDSGLFVPSDRRIVRAHEGRRPLMGASQQALLMAGAAAAANDPFWANVIFLYNHSSTAIDTSTVGRTITDNGVDTSISATNPYIGGMHSMLCVGSSGNFSCSDVADIRLAGNVFTIELILRTDLIDANTRYIWQKYSSSNGHGWYIYQQATTGLLVFQTRNAFSNRASITSTSAISSTYAHVAFCVNGTTSNGVTCWFNGASGATPTTATGAPSNSTTDMQLLGEPAGSGSQQLNGNIAAARITTAVRYTAPFTPPAGVFPTS